MKKILSLSLVLSAITISTASLAVSEEPALLLGTSAPQEITEQVISETATQANEGEQEVIKSISELPIKVTVDGEELEFDVEPFIEDGRVLVPFRKIFEVLGCKVEYYDESQIVVARKGESYISLTIGSSTMYVNNEEVQIDVPAQIVDGRTFVPIRAIANSLEADVEWLSETNTVCITRKQGDHKITEGIIDEVVKNEEGIVLLKIWSMYPIIENEDGNSYIDELNANYKANAEQNVANAKAEYAEEAQDYYNMRMSDSVTSEFIPYEFEQSFTINKDKDGILSITELCYSYTGGAHGFTEKISKTYDLNEKKELSLTDIVAGTKEEVNDFVYETFSKDIDNNEGYFENAKDTIKEEIDTVNFYITDDSLVLYFDVYQVGPYAMGYPTVEVPFEGNESIFKI